MLNDLCCRLSALLDGCHCRPTLTVAKNDDRHCQRSKNAAVNDGSCVPALRQWFDAENSNWIDKTRTQTFANDIDCNRFQEMEVTFQ